MNRKYIYNKYGEKVCGILENETNKRLILICHGSRGTKDGDLQVELSNKLSQHLDLILQVIRNSFHL